MWSAPYTLDNVPITGYNINDDQGTLIDTVNTTKYILTSSNDDPCNVTTVYVSGINGAGIGDSNNVMYYIVRGIAFFRKIIYFSFYKLAPKSGSIHLLLLIQTTVYDMTISIQIFVNVSTPT